MQPRGGMVGPSGGFRLWAIFLPPGAGFGPGKGNIMNGGTVAGHLKAEKKSK